jgi:hypothetical protein
MKKIFLTIVAGLFLNSWLTAQVAVSNDSTQAHPSAGLEIKFSDKGYLQPRLTGSQIQAISNPDVGLMVYNLTANKPVYFDGKKWRNFDHTSTWFGCGDPLEVIHIAGNAVPVNKTLVYGTVTGIPGEPDKCWITRNLGADRQASTKGDNTEASAGWYWQFNRLQGYKHDGTTRTPNAAWISNISENSNWTSNNDPCAIELGGRWRIPTGTEWKNIDAGTGTNWSNWNGPWGSALKLHAAGCLNGANGAITLRGTNGRYWGNGSWTATSAWMFCFSNSNCIADSTYQKWWAGTVRCIQCPEATTFISPSAGSHVVSHNRITWKWSAVAGAAGYKWNTINDYFTAYDMLDSLFKIESSLEYGTAYTRYIWAYDSCGGHSNSVALNDTILAISCGTDSLYIDHVAGSVAPVSKTVSYATVTGIPGEPDKCWITSNLGSDHQATAVNDATEPSAGWYWQFNRKQGYKHTGTTVTPAWNLTLIDEDSDLVPANDPCTIELGAGWRIPTSTEWGNVDNAGAWMDWTGPWNSALKLHAAGFIRNFDGSMLNRGSSGVYLTGNQEDSSNAKAFYFNNNNCYLSQGSKTHGTSVRCIEP